MNHRRFWGKDMAQALQFVRSSLGPDALILETKGVERDQGGGVEITALADQVEDERITGEEERHFPSNFNSMDAVRQELATLKSMLYWLVPTLGPQQKFLNMCLEQGLAPETITRLSEAMKDSNGADERENFHLALGRLIPGGGTIREESDRLALIGPTGVGKTTSLIKLTVFETQRRKCQVGWINTDQRGLTGGDPLAIYAGILGVRYETAAGRAELKRALDRLAHCDLVLVDTAGVNPRDKAGIKELTRLFHGLAGVRRTLLLSAVTNKRDMCDWLANFKKVGLDSLFFTKLDECRYLGPVIDTALTANYPLSYMTLGQNLAGDLEIARSGSLASLLFTGVNL